MSLPLGRETVNIQKRLTVSRTTYISALLIKLLAQPHYPAIS
jgi:hypothetical protein